MQSTVKDGDPAWAGALAGEPLGLPSYHITEPEIKAQIDADTYDAEVGLADIALDTEEIAWSSGRYAGDNTPYAEVDADFCGSPVARSIGGCLLPVLRGPFRPRGDHTQVVSIYAAVAPGCSVKGVRSGSY